MPIVLTRAELAILTNKAEWRIAMESYDWSKMTEGLSCSQASLPMGGVDAQSSFAMAYHSIVSIRARCYKNVDTFKGESSSYTADAILSTKSSTGRQLVVRLSAAPEAKLEMIVCSNSPEESGSCLANYEGKYKRLAEGIGKIDEKARKRVLETIKVEMKLDAALHKILMKAPVGEIYPAIGVVRETLIKSLEGFDPIHIETGEVMANLHSHKPDTSFDSNESQSVSIKILDWKKRLSRIVDDALIAPKETAQEGK